MDSFIINDTVEPTGQDQHVRSYIRLARRGERIPTDVTDAYVSALEARVCELIGSEPKDFARAAVLIYDIFRLRDENEEAEQIARLFDLPAMVLFQVPPLVRSIDQMGRTLPSKASGGVLERIDDLNRLVIMALDGDDNVDVVRRLLDLREAISETHRDRTQSEAVSVAGDRLIHLVNAFFFDRLTAIPELRDYVVGLELGL